MSKNTFTLSNPSEGALTDVFYWDKNGNLVKVDRDQLVSESVRYVGSEPFYKSTAELLID